MTLAISQPTREDTVCESIRIRGMVQGVGFRPMVWRIANELGLSGNVLNDGEGVIVRVRGSAAEIDGLIDKIRREVPPLARIDAIERDLLESDEAIPSEFSIVNSQAGPSLTAVTPDAASCDACLTDSLDPFGRRYRYALTNCTHCGPRFSILRSIPYDRGNTSMAKFDLCDACGEEYGSPADRRFHAQPNACYHCGPTVSLQRLDGKPLCLEGLSQLDEVDAACSLLQSGSLLAVKGIGGFHLACDATNSQAVETLRRSKRRPHKPFAMMARDLEVIRRFARVNGEEARLLASHEAPIVLLEALEQPRIGAPRQFGEPAGERASDVHAIADAVAPGQKYLGFMLPYTPLHHLMLKRMNRPIVLTSGNICDEPQTIDNAEASDRLDGIAEYLLWHDRDIVNRVDDSVARLMLGKARLLRRSRGYAPSPLPLPPGFESAADTLAMGAELKNTFCLIQQGSALLSQHMGDLENAATYADYLKNLRLYAELFEHRPQQIAIDRHPEYLSSKLGVEIAERDSLPLHRIQHHHAHIAACLAENLRPINAPPVLGVALDGLGYGADDGFWGGEFLLADYRHAERLGSFKPIALLGASRAMLEPWRNTYAHLMAEMGWVNLKHNYSELELVRFFESKPLASFDAMLANGKNAPLASSCGRLFDAVAAALGICRERVSYEGQAASQLESIVDLDALHNEDALLAYPFAIPRLDGLPYIEPLAMWQALLGDLILNTPAPVMAARFHRGLANVIVTMIDRLCTRDEQRYCDSVALSGGVFQNKILFELVVRQLETRGFEVLTHQLVPANDGGIALGQAVIAAARDMQPKPSGA